MARVSSAALIVLLLFFAAIEAIGTNHTKASVFSQDTILHIEFQDGFQNDKVKVFVEDILIYKSNSLLSDFSSGYTGLSITIIKIKNEKGECKEYVISSNSGKFEIKRIKCVSVVSISLRINGKKFTINNMISSSKYIGIGKYKIKNDIYIKFDTSEFEYF